MPKYHTVPRYLAPAGEPKKGGECHVLVRDEEGLRLGLQVI